MSPSSLAIALSKLLNSTNLQSQTILFFENWRGWSGMAQWNFGSTRKVWFAIDMQCMSYEQLHPICLHHESASCRTAGSCWARYRQIRTVLEMIEEFNIEMDSIHHTLQLHKFKLFHLFKKVVFYACPTSETVWIVMNCSCSWHDNFLDQKTFWRHTNYRPEH